MKVTVMEYNLWSYQLYRQVLLLLHVSNFLDACVTYSAIFILGRTHHIVGNECQISLLYIEDVCRLLSINVCAL